MQVLINVFLLFEIVSFVNVDGININNIIVASI